MAPKAVLLVSLLVSYALCSSKGDQANQVVETKQGSHNATISPQDCSIQCCNCCGRSCVFCCDKKAAYMRGKPMTEAEKAAYEIPMTEAEPHN